MSVTRPHSCAGQASRGFTIIEVMVALVVLSVGLLGLAGMQLNGLRYNYGAYSRSQATLMAYDIIDRMRANVDGVFLGDYDAPINTATNTTPAQACISTTTGCTPGEIASEDIYEWCQLFNATPPILPNASATMTRTGTTFTVTVTWQERDASKSLTISVQPSAQL